MQYSCSKCREELFSLWLERIVSSLNKRGHSLFLRFEGGEFVIDLPEKNKIIIILFSQDEVSFNSEGTHSSERKIFKTDDWLGLLVLVYTHLEY